jgi:hypothetical protein
VAYVIGDRVKVRRDLEFGPGPWPAEPTGTIASEYEVVEGRTGPLRTYWVVFDEPQIDAERDGPYTSSQVLEKYLELINDQSQ